ncbi:MAG TPA: nitrate- and nitrite sensing domain-containing protein, partial [Jiangellaceae bacterium]|nr:nitrate- and nitrite sensing domain-containing protein [Jiangellaceae bacterium]
MTRNPRGHRSNRTGVAMRAHATERPTAADQPEASGRPKREPRASSFWRSFLHDRSVRSRVGALVLLPLLGALVLGAFLFRDALTRASAASGVERNARVAVTALEAAERLQDERDVSGLYDIGATGQGAVADARNATDEAIATLNEQLAELPDDVDPAVAEARRSTEVQLGLLDAYRGSRDIVLEPFDEPGVDDYNLMVEALLRFVKASGSASTDAELVVEVDTLDALARATETASVERALLAHVLATGDPLSDEQRQREAISVGEQDYLISRFVSTAEPEVRSQFYSTVPGTLGPVAAVRAGALATGEEPDATPEEWYQAATGRIDVFRDIQAGMAESIVDEASGTATRAQIAAGATAVAILVVLAATVALAAAVARSIIGPLRRLRGAALQTADTGLPALVSRIQSDGPAVIRNVGDAVQPEGKDEIGQVANAFNDVHSTAVRVAGEQALLRQNLDTIVVNLSRRTQSLVDRQLGEIEELEARERDADQLGTLFRIDHLATRVRRHAESLLVLAGVEEMRRTGTAAPVLDVVRTAVGEVEQYPRVKFGVMPTDLVTPAAVDDVAHLLAELLDNATEFSAPSTPVMITSQPLLGGGLRIQVADSGIGIPLDQLASFNERLREPGDIDVAASRTLGLYVVARLASRHGIVVRLVRGEPNGTVAQVDLPAHLVVSPLDTTDGVMPARAESQAPTPLLGGVPIEEQVRRAVEQSPPARAIETSHRSQSPPTPSQAAPPGRPVQPVNGLVGANGLPTRTPRSFDESDQKPKRSLRAPEPPLPEADAPIYEAVRSAWFRRGGGPIDWSGPADEGWRRAAAALRTAEEAASARRTHREEAARAPVTRPEPSPEPSPEPQRSPEPVVEEPAYSASGLPVRRRGATLVP